MKTAIPMGLKPMRDIMKPFTKAEKDTIYDWSKECGGHNAAKSLFSDRIPKQDAIHTANIASAIEAAPYFMSSSVSITKTDRG